MLFISDEQEKENDEQEKKNERANSEPNFIFKYMTWQSTLETARNATYTDKNILNLNIYIIKGGILSHVSFLLFSILYILLQQ